MQPSRRHCLSASLAALVLLSLAPRTHAKTLTITSTPPGATVEIDDQVVGPTPYQTDYPGGYFHKPHTVFGARLERSMVLRISKEGYLTQEITLTKGPFEWVAITGRHHGDYFLLRSNHFDVKLEPAPAHSDRTPETIGREGPMRPPAANLVSSNQDEALVATGSVAVTSEPASAEIYVDGQFVGQSPATLRLRSGTHHIEVKAQGKQEWERDLDVTKDSQLTLHPVLDPAQ